MPELLKLLPYEEARALFFSHLPAREPAFEIIETVNALGRLAAEAIYSPHPLPEFTRSAMDGYAVRAGDTSGASDSLPAYLMLVGEVPMGGVPDFTIQPGECALIHTGGMLPVGANAVVMMEYTLSRKRGDESEVGILQAAADGDNIIGVGEDVAEGQIVLAAGARIRPAEIGGLMALGKTTLRVAKKTKVGIISGGDEVIPPEWRPLPGQVRDVNSHSLAALVTQAGGEAVLYGIVPDDFDALKSIAAQALAECEMVLITAGSSVSGRDLTFEVIQSLGKPGVLVHGINIRPGKPTILASCDDKPVIGLPGNPVSALVIAKLFVVPAIEKLLGMPVEKPYPAVQARLTVNISSATGREEWLPVRLCFRPEHDSGPLFDAEPIFFKSNLIFSLVAADGLLHILPEAREVNAGEVVEVILL